MPDEVTTEALEQLKCQWLEEIYEIYENFITTTWKKPCRVKRINAIPDAENFYKTLNESLSGHILQPAILEYVKDLDADTKLDLYVSIGKIMKEGAPTRSEIQDGKGKRDNKDNNDIQTDRHSRPDSSPEPNDSDKSAETLENIKLSLPTAVADFTRTSLKSKPAFARSGTIDSKLKDKEGKTVEHLPIKRSKISNVRVFSDDSD